MRFYSGPSDGIEYHCGLYFRTFGHHLSIILKIGGPEVSNNFFSSHPTVRSPTGSYGPSIYKWLPIYLVFSLLASLGYAKRLLLAARTQVPSSSY